MSKSDTLGETGGSESSVRYCSRGHYQNDTPTLRHPEGEDVRQEVAHQTSGYHECCEVETLRVIECCQVDTLRVIEGWTAG